MGIVDVTTDTRYGKEVKQLKKSDLTRVSRQNGWFFDWNEELCQKERQVYKLLIANDDQIQALLSLELAENYIELHLIEAAPHNFGRAKQFRGAPANLVAFACKKSFELGFEGNVTFRAKSKLIQHYIDSLGLQFC